MISRLLSAPIFLFLFAYGFLSHFTSSEFWPITISKTWLTPSQFETSMLQKPLLTLFLSVFHLVKMPDLVHLIVVKAIFAAFCTYGFYHFIKFVLKRAGFDYHDKPLINIVAALFVLACPTYLNYFFSIRSDQVACALFCLFLLFCEEKKQISAAAALALIPLFGVKEILFLLPGGIYYLWTFGNQASKKVSKKNLLYILGFAFTALIWIVALNIQFFYYFMEAYEGTNYLDRFNTYYYKQELFLLIATVGIWMYIFAAKQTEYYKEAVISFIFTMLLWFFPQSYYFYMASFLPFIYLPIVIVFLRMKIYRSLKFAMVAVHIFFVIRSTLTLKALFFDSVAYQYSYISKASDFIQRHHFLYMDGMGLLPQAALEP